jgi:sugar/nucleoside kinase (ribokinase family)
MRIPIVTNRVVDSVGAGDAFLSLTAPLAYLEAPPELTLLLGNLAGGMAANIIGNSDFIRKEELSKWLRTLMK